VQKIVQNPISDICQT